jgi:hypothetical protein
MVDFTEPVTLNFIFKTISVIFALSLMGVAFIKFKKK